eukprot:5823721-Prorocentrum_lima.AAC.1
MTSSLVGSEMCIRDRLRRLAGAIAVRENWSGMRSVKVSGTRGDFPEPVSYTHLTLPTICSV